jgi:hypothetical protein
MTRAMLKILQALPKLYSGLFTFNSGKSSRCSYLETKKEPAKARSDSNFGGSQVESRGVFLALGLLSKSR